RERAPRRGFSARRCQLSLLCVTVSKAEVRNRLTRMRPGGMLQMLHCASDLILFAADDTHQHMSGEILGLRTKVRFQPLLRPGELVFSNRLLHTGVVEIRGCQGLGKTKQGRDRKAPQNPVPQNPVRYPKSAISAGSGCLVD